MAGVRFRVRREPHFKRRRRTFAAIVAGGVFVVFVAQGGFASRVSEPLVRTTPAPARRADPSNPIVIENRRPGTPTWRIGREAGSSLQGFAAATSVRPGHDLSLYVNTRYPTFSVRVFRMGWYGGDEARLVWFRRGIAGTKQLPATVDPETNMVETNWSPSVAIPVGDDWTTGAYLVKLVAPEGQANFIPFTVREGEHRAPIVFQSSVTTWQAYNKWGGHSLYLGFGPGGRELARERATVVSFDRPYAQGAGASDFLGLELPLISWLEKLGYDVGYATDIDTHADPELLRRRHAFLSLGHDEYWSTRMRRHVERALDHGVNLAFFGANAMFRHIRLERSPIGPHRREVNYRSAAADPATDVDPNQATVSWRDPPLSEPEDAILGAMYECNPVKGDLVVRDATTWLFEGTDLKLGDRITGLLGPEYDRVFPNNSHPKRIWLLFRTPVFCGGASSVADTTFARFPSGAGVFNAATSNFLCAFAGCEEAPADQRIQALIRNLMDVYLGFKAPAPEPDPQPFSVSASRVGQARERTTRLPSAATPTPYPYGPRTPQPPTYYTPAPAYTAPPSTPQPRRPRLFP